MTDIMTSKPLKSELTTEEQNDFRECESVIKIHRTKSLEACAALAKIRDNWLYRDQYATFEEYCQKVWGYGRSYINRQIGAAHVIEVLGPIGPKIECEAVARPLVGLEDEQIVTAYKEAEKQAGGKLPTAKMVAKAAAAFKPAKPVKAVVVESSIEAPTEWDRAFEQLARAEKAGIACKVSLMLQELAALRKCLEELAGAKSPKNSTPELDPTELDTTVDINTVGEADGDCYLT